MNKLIYGITLCFVFSSGSVDSAPLSPLAQQVKKIVEQKKLIPNPECADYLYIPDDEPGVDIVNIMEEHGGNCPGDPQTEPRIFSVYVDQKTQEMESDIDMDDQVNGNRSIFPPKE